MALVTLWFVSAANPASVLEQEPKADRGFARKYLAQLDPSLPLTHIGDFDMVRSAAPGPSEYYIGGYPGLSVVQTVMPDLHKLSELPEEFRNLVNTPDVYATAVFDEGFRACAHTASDGEPAPGSNSDLALQEDEKYHITGEVDDTPAPEYDPSFGAFAHWSAGTLKRSFSATRQNILEDIGLPEPFESQFWAGNASATGIELPFHPSELAMASVEGWLGFSISPYDDGAAQLPVAAFATDGRPEAKSSEYGSNAAGRTQLSDRGALRDRVLPPASQDVSLHQEEQGYDDYAEAGAPAEPSGQEVVRELGKSFLTTVRWGANAALRKIRSLRR
ncbi:hypothetical protein CRES_0333 [Corynebacterium resistens DSM 45100]|uniref:Uncharacterized protein n=1 Tax=Corynebacterium resistens (strain DSM 45100 / JCM 12819 / GTC 2026 / SICGH 158) TaxID=662755 RepID=F8DXF1_CORRG|nr:hypothetical protein [Corynebacterium resistens]AEI08696.1 hypothetical protein CRES_0333 [Corynebacterium resistens DSM 45100]